MITVPFYKVKLILFAGILFNRVNAAAINHKLIVFRLSYIGKFIPRVCTEGLTELTIGSISNILLLTNF